MKPRFSSSLLYWIGYLYLQFLNCKKRRKKKLLKWEGRHLKLLELWYYSCKAVRGSRFPNVKQLLPRLESSLQSRQVKRTPWDSSNELIIWKMNPLVVPATSVKFKSAFLQASWAVNILRELLCIWSDWKSLNGLNSYYTLHQIQGNWADWNFVTALRVNSRLITHARMQRWIWNLQLPTDSTFKY